MTTSKICTCLYVGDLHTDVTEAILYDTFKKYGNILTISLRRNRLVRKSVGYSYIFYETINEAKMAENDSNSIEILGKSCTVVISNKEVSPESIAGHLLIDNLDASVTEQNIFDIFSEFGETASCKLKTDGSGESKLSAFVNFYEEEDAERALEALNGKTIKNTVVNVTRFNPNNRTKQLTKCFICNFDPLYEDDDLEALFDEYGEIVNVKVIVDSDNNSLGYGYVYFKEHEQALKAFKNLNGMEINGRKMYVEMSEMGELKSRYDKFKQEKIQQNTNSVNLYIKNLGKEIDDERLNDEFKSYGNIISAKVMLNKETGNSKRFGFVCFSTPDEAAKAISEMNGKIVDGKQLYVALSEKKEDRVAHLRTKFAKRIPNNQSAFVSPNMVQLMNFSGVRNLPINRPANMINTYNRAPYMQFGRNNYLIPQQSYIQNVNPIDMQRIYAILHLAAVNIQSQNLGANMNPQRNMTFQYGDNLTNIKLEVQHQMTEQPEKQELAEDSPDIVNVVIQADKKILGDKIYPLVYKFAGDCAGKITGMFLELENTELEHMIENESSLRMKVEEGVLIIKNHHKNETKV